MPSVAGGAVGFLSQGLWATRLVAQSLQEEGTMPTLASPRRLIHMTVSDYMTVADYVVIGVVALLILWGAARLFR